jgi:hypothetical protein
MTRIDDKGLIPEATPATQPARPRVEPPIARVQDGKVTLQRITAGSSIAYTTDAGRRARWKIYVGPVALEPGQTLRAVACRAGFEESEEVRVTGVRWGSGGGEAVRRGSGEAGKR